MVLEKGKFFHLETEKRWRKNTSYFISVKNKHIILNNLIDVQLEMLKLLWFTKFHSEKWELENSVGPDVTRQTGKDSGQLRKRKKQWRKEYGTPWKKWDFLLSSKDYAIIICFSLSLWEKVTRQGAYPHFYSKT